MIEMLLLRPDSQKVIDANSHEGIKQRLFCKKVKIRVKRSLI